MAVALGDRVADAMGSEEVVDGLLCAPGDGIAAGGVVEDEGEVLIPQFGVCGQLLIVGRHAEHMLGLVLQHQTAQLGRVEVGDDDDREAQHQRQMDAAGVAVGDEGGHDIHELLAPVEQLIVGAELLRDGVEAVVGEHDALGFSGGAGGVDERRQILRLGARGEFRAVAFRQPLIKSHDPHVAVLMLLNGFARDDDGFQGGMVFRVADRLPTVEAPRGEQLRAAVVNDVT